MNGKFLLDTNIIIGLFAQDQAIIQNLALVDEVYVPSVVIGELYFGARKSQKATDNLARVRRFAEANRLLDCNAETAYYYGTLKHQVQTQGKPIPENDLWIAATAQQYDLTLVSRDAHFQIIKGLLLVAW